MTFGGTAELTPVDDALDVLVTGVDRLLKLVDDHGLEALDDAGLVGFLQGFERLRNRMWLIDHQLIADGLRRDLPTALCQGSMRRVLGSALSISKGEAARRVRAAEAV